MKRKYSTPEILVVELDTETLMQQIYVGSPNLNAPKDNSSDEDEEIYIEAPSYRTNLWQ